VFSLLALPGLIASVYAWWVPAFAKAERYHTVLNAVAYWSLFWFYTIYPAVSVAVVAPWNCHWVHPPPSPRTPNPHTPHPKTPNPTHKTHTLNPKTPLLTPPPHTLHPEIETPL